MRGIAAALLAAGLLAALVATIAVVTRPAGEVAVLPVPEPGQAVTGLRPDGAPVIVTRDTAGQVHAFLGVVPHAGLPLTWCPRSQMFTEALGASRFDSTGRYLSGPAPHGLYRIAVKAADGPVVLGERLPPEPRVAGLKSPARPNPDDPCVFSEGYLLGVRPPVSEVPRFATPREAARSTGWVRFDTVLETAGQGLRLCDLPGCRRPVEVTSLLPGSWQPEGTAAGVFFGRVDRGAIADLVVPVWADETLPTEIAAPLEWCGSGQLLRWEPTAVTVGTLDAPADPSVQCGWGAADPPDNLRGRTVTLPLAGYATHLAEGWTASPAVQAALARDDLRATIAVAGGRATQVWVTELTAAPAVPG